MDLKHFFRKIREAEIAITEDFPLVTSLETADGGKAGQVSEVTKAQAARMIVEGRATLASDEDRVRYFANQEAAKKASEKAELAKRVQVAIISESSLHGSEIGKKK